MKCDKYVINMWSICADYCEKSLDVVDAICFSFVRINIISTRQKIDLTSTKYYSNHSELSSCYWDGNSRGSNTDRTDNRPTCDPLCLLDTLINSTIFWRQLKHSWVKEESLNVIIINITFNWHSYLTLAMLLIVLLMSLNFHTHWRDCLARVLLLSTLHLL